MNFRKKIWIVVFLSMLLLSGCGGAAETQDVNLMLTQGVGTMVAAFFQTQTAMFTPATNTGTATQTPYATPTLFGTPTLLKSPTSTLFYFTFTPGTPSPTGTFYTSTPNPGSLAYGCNNLAFIRDVTIPAGTVIRPREGFTKTWKVQNTGTCNWMYHYALTPAGGDLMNGETTRIQKLVTPQDWNELSVDLEAPRNGGTYTGYWRLADADGHMFGATLVVKITVGEPPTDTPIPTDTVAPPTSTGTSTMTPTVTPTETPPTP